MNLVEVPGHTGPVAPPHASEPLRILLAEGRDPQNYETAQSEKGRKQKTNILKFQIDNSDKGFEFEYFLALGCTLWRGKSPPLCFTTLPE